MATVIEMPKMSDTMVKGIILSWKKKEGDAVSPGDVIAEVETDKANMEMEVFDGGVLRKQLVKVGDGVPVGAPLAIVTEDADEDITALLAKLSGGASAPAPAAKGDKKETAAAPAPAAKASVGGGAIIPPAAPAAPATGDGRPFASPLAARIASEHGLDLHLIKGSGPGGRIIKRDIEDALAKRTAAPVPSAPSTATRANVPVAPPLPGGSAAAPVPAPAPVALAPSAPQAFEDIPVSTMRGVIASRLQQSKSTIPHFYTEIVVDAGELLEFRKKINALRGDKAPKVTINDIILKATAIAITRNPMINASFQGTFIRKFNRVDISVAVAIEDGLITPVVRDAAGKGIERISAEVKELAARAQVKKLKPEEYTGGTFTISNLGMYGVKSFNAIVNPPEAAILAVGGVLETPVVRNGAVVAGHTLSLTLSCDHRVIDGAVAASFLRDLKQILEEPVLLAL